MVTILKSPSSVCNKFFQLQVYWSSWPLSAMPGEVIYRWTPLICGRENLEFDISSEPWQRTCVLYIYNISVSAEGFMCTHIYAQMWWVTECKTICMKVWSETARSPGSGNTWRSSFWLLVALQSDSSSCYTP